MWIKPVKSTSLLPKAVRNFFSHAREDSGKLFFAGRLTPFFPEGKNYSMAWQ
jgi:hypothetical protein